MTGRQLGTLGLVGIGYFVVALVALHFLEPDFSIVDEYTSDYALGESFGWLMRTVFLGAAIGAISIALGLRATLAPGKRVKASWILMFTAGIGFIVVATFNGDATGVEDLSTSGIIHVAAAGILFLCLLICVWFLRGVFKRDDRWQRLTTTQLVFAIAYTIMFVVSFGVSEDGPVGLIQRIFVVVVMAWLAFLAWQVREHDSAAPDTN